MRSIFLLPALIISVSVLTAPAGSGQRAFARQITFVQAPQSRNQTQNQQGLPPEQKRSLSKYGPEDVFGTGEQEENRNRDSEQQRRARARPTPVSIQSATPEATPSVAPSATPTQLTASPSPTIAVASAGSQARRLPSAQSLSGQDDSKWTVPVLLVLAWVVSAALIFVLIKLIGKLRESSNN